jgi:hydrogenase 3 maturation protease
MDIQEQLIDALQGNVVIVGMGNICRGDDAAGSRVAQLIRSAPGVRVIDAEENPENHLCQVAELQPDTILLIDCVDLGCSPGSVALLDADKTLSYWPSTHRVPLNLIVDYLKRTTRARMSVIAIQPQQTGFFEPMSADVGSAVESIADVLNSIVGTRSLLPSIKSARPTVREVPV